MGTVGAHACSEGKGAHVVVLKVQGRGRGKDVSGGMDRAKPRGGDGNGRRDEVRVTRTGQGR